jgi:molybdopterin/thiamine biosynthesis adenylyltransferase
MESVSTDTCQGGIVLSVPVYAPKAANSIASKDRCAQWSYEEAFKRNRGLITEDEQQRLRNSRVAIAGMGGVGGVHLITLARLGIGKFTIADPDIFEVANFNRQVGATVANLGRNKAQAMAETALDINPGLELRVFQNAVDESNIDEFLKDVDLVVDGLDFFAIDARRMLFRCAAERGIWAITAGPIGFSTAWLTFDPCGMRFDDYFDLRDEMAPLEKAVAFGIGLAPKATHRHYIDFREVDVANHRGPSASLACELAAGVAATEALKILLGRGTLRPAPCFGQFDSYRQQTKLGRLWFGNRGFGQRIKRAWLLKKMSAMSTR